MRRAVRCTDSVVVLTRQRRLPFLHVLSTLVEDLLDIVGRSYDGIDYVVLHDIHETMLDPGESDHSPLHGPLAQAPGDQRASGPDKSLTCWPPPARPAAARSVRFSSSFERHVTTSQ